MVVRLVEALFALGVLEVLEVLEALAELLQQVEGVVGGLLPLMVAGFPHLLAIGIGARQGAGRFFGLVVEAAWWLCPVERGAGVGLSLPQQLSCHSLYLMWMGSHPGRIAQSLS